MPRRKLTRIKLTASIDPVAGGLPTEVLLLHFGENDSSNGVITLDKESASELMQAWARHVGNNDRQGMIDLEHLSLDPMGANFDPDARGWFDLSLRDDGLWIENIKWTPDGEQRLLARSQRYLSPCMAIDPETNRVVELINVALTAIPALHEAPELIAARSSMEEQMDENGPSKDQRVAEVLAAMGGDPKMLARVAKALGLEDGATIDEVRTALEGLASQIAKAESVLIDDTADTSEAPAGEAIGTSDEAIASAAIPATDEEDKVACNALRRLTGKATIALALPVIETWREAAVQQERWQRDRATIELAERRDLVAQLIKLGAELPATAWKMDR